MRFLVVAEPRFQIPMEMLPAVMGGFAAWWEQNKSSWESAGFFAGREGGCGICKVKDEMAFHQMMMTWPLAPFSDVKTHALIDVSDGIAFANEMISQMGG